MSLKRDFSKVEYRIKLLSGNNVVLVEANGFESEIFVPEIQNGRISFQNIVPNRRCCYTGNTPTVKGLIRRKKRSVLSASEQHLANATMGCTRESMSPSRTWRLQGGGGGVNDYSHTRSPLAFSTPAPAPSPTPSYIIRHQMKCNKENYEHLRQPRTLAQAYNTIELLRPKPSSPMPQKHQTSGTTKTVRIQCEQTEIDKHMRESGGGVGAGCGDSGSDFNIPDVPTLTPCSLQSSTENNKIQPAQLQTPTTVTKWRKCITPIRTYSRHPLNVPALPACSPNVKKIRNTKSLPSATQGTKGNYRIELKKRKLIIDPKTAISPHTFKQQQNSTAHLRRRSVERARMAAAMPNTSKRYEASKGTAFDMLTTPNRSNVMAAKLQQQFRKACVNKASSTCPKYKILCKLPPLEEPGRVKVNMLPSLPPSNITAAAMMEKACSSAIQTCEHATQAKRMRWSGQQ